MKVHHCILSKENCYQERRNIDEGILEEGWISRFRNMNKANSDVKSASRQL